MDDDPANASLDCLAILATRSCTCAEREHAFQRLLSLTVGWWGACALVLFAQAVGAAAPARARVGRGNEAQLDWDGAADQALVMLFEGADTIGPDPRQWLWDTIERIVAQQMPRVNIAPAPVSEGHTVDRVRSGLRRHRIGFCRILLLSSLTIHSLGELIRRPRRTGRT